MAEAEVTEVSIGTLSMSEFNRARDEGKTTVEQKAVAVEEPEPKAAEEETEEKATDTDKHKSKGGFQKRIDRLVKQIAAAEEERETFRKRAEEAEAKASGKPKEEVAAPVETKPQRDQFENDADYIDALVEHKIAMKREAEEKEARAAAQREIQNTFNKRYIEESAKHEDFKEIMSQEVVFPNTVGTAIIEEMDNGPSVAYYIGKHPEIAVEMMGVGPMKAVAMAWKISEQLEGDKPEAEEVEEKEEKPEVKAKPVSKAPPPIKPVSGGSTKSSVPLDKMDMESYTKARQSGRVS